jgi:flagellar basal-body rod modification protein FlgD
MEYAEFTSQTAQFAALEQLQVINENLGYLQKYQSAIFDENAVSFIGKSIKVSDNTIDMTDGASEELHFELESDANEVYIYIYDSNYDLVKEIIETGNFSAGEQVLTWDGTDDSGNQVPDDRYFFEVQAVDDNGTTIIGEPFYEGTVDAVNFWNGTAYLTSGNREIAMGNVLKVTAAEEDE